MTRLALGDYEAIGVKSTQSLPTQYFLQRLSTPVLFLYPTPINSTDVMRYWRIRRIEDITANTVNGVDQNVDVPSRWIEAMCSGLAYFLGKKRPGIDGNMRAELKLDYEEAFSRAQSAELSLSNLLGADLSTETSRASSAAFSFFFYILFCLKEIK